jgi:IS30 family transposase
VKLSRRCRLICSALDLSAEDETRRRSPAAPKALGQLPAGLRRTLAWDQRNELAMHQSVTAETGTEVFFCDAHSPCQRGSNENMNGLLRDYFPKGMDLARVADELAQIAALPAQGQHHDEVPRLRH